MATAPDDPVVTGGTMIRITKRQRAGTDHEVVQITGGKATYRREPCATCPWRTDQVGTFPAEAFRISAPTAYDASFETFACHVAGSNKPLICAGFLLQNSLNNIGARIRGIAGGADCRSEAPLHASYKAMAISNGVAPDDPALSRCRGDDE